MEQVEAFAFKPTVQQFASQNVENMSEGSWQKVSLENSTEPGAEPMDLGHVTTDSSDPAERILQLHLWLDIT